MTSAAGATVAPTSKCQARVTRQPKQVKQPNGELRISGRGFRKGDFALVWSVPSQTEPNRYHLVIEVTTGVFTCDCKAAQFGRRDCAHRQVVRETLAREEAEFLARLAALQAADAREAAYEEADDAEAAQRAADRETAILHRDTRPFSIWK